MAVIWLIAFFWEEWEGGCYSALVDVDVMEERSAILSHGRPQYDVVNWINSEDWSFITRDRLTKLNVIFQQAFNPEVYLGYTSQSNKHVSIVRFSPFETDFLLLLQWCEAMGWLCSAELNLDVLRTVLRLIPHSRCQLLSSPE